MSRQAVVSTSVETHIPGGTAAADGADTSVVSIADIPMVFVAASAAVGALVELPIPIWVALVVGMCSRTIGWPPLRLGLISLALFLLVGSRGYEARLGLAPPDPRSFVGEVTLLGDPEPAGRGIRVLVRVERRRVEAWAAGPASWEIQSMLAGERIRVDGRLGPLQADGPLREWLDQRHVSGRLNISKVTGPPRAGVLPTRLANGLRRNLVVGAGSLTHDQQSLFTGLVFGDDRFQSPVTVEDFRGSGLGHLLAVSGQNVAFVLAIIGPVLRRLSLMPRFGALLAALCFFALLTRFEPSVLRATVMAAIAAGLTTIGGRSSRLRMLALAVILVLVIDPFLVRSLGFQLSVGAAAGILLFSTGLSARLPGPRVLADGLAVTLAAQLGVAPIALPVFGSLPLVALPANIVAAPVAGPMMAWGLTGGMVAGLLPPRGAELLHLPTQIGVGWIAGVARLASGSQLGDITARDVMIGGGCGLAVLAVHRLADIRWKLARSQIGVLSTLIGLAALVLSVGRSTDAGFVQQDGLSIWQGDATVVVLADDVRPGRALAALRMQRVDRIDLLISTSGSRAEAQTADAVAARHQVRAVVAPQAHPFGRASPVEAPAEFVLGDARILLAHGAGVGTLRVDIEPIEPRPNVTG